MPDSRRRFALLLACTLLLGSWPCQAQSLASEVSQSSYTNYLRNVLETRAGDNRGPRTVQHDEVRQRILDAFTSYGLKVSQQEFQYQGNVGVNVAGVIEGKTRSINYFVVGAHYDSVMNPGADDDASGVAALLEAARVASMHDFEESIVFVAFDLEELGMIGSKAWVADHASDRIQGMVQLDMIAYNEPGEYRNVIAICTPNNYYNQSRTAFEDAVRQYSGGLQPVYGGISTRSDHASFAGLAPSIEVIESRFYGNTNYHKAADTVDTANYIDYEYASRVTRATVGYLDTQAVTVPDVEGEMRFRAGGILNAANYVAGTAAPSALMALKGAGLVTGNTAGTTVTVRDSQGAERAATTIYASPGQINIVMPDALAEGPGMITVARGDGIRQSAGLVIRRIAPGVFSADSSGSGAAVAQAVRITPNGTQTWQNLFWCGSSTYCPAVPIDFGGSDDRVVLVLYGTGIRGASGMGSVKVSLGGQELACLYAGPQPTNDGLDQINVELPRSLQGMGQVMLQLTVDGVPATPVVVDLGQE